MSTNLLVDMPPSGIHYLLRLEINYLEIHLHHFNELSFTQLDCSIPVKLEVLMHPSLRKLIKISSVSFIFVLLLLVSAGKWNYWQAWLYFSISLLMNTANVLLLEDNPDLSQERSKPGKDSQAWDKKLLGLGFLLNIITFIIAGLDSGRFHLTPELPWTWTLIGAALNILGGSIFLRALKENKFFSAIVRIQSDRNHHVCTTGPYRFVRHPGYIGMIIGTLGFPFLFLSYWSAIPTALSIILLIIRTKKEDLFLSEELAGYKEYQKSTSYLLIPKVW